MRSRPLALVVSLLFVATLSGCDAIGKRLAKKSIAQLERQVAEQQETIDQLTAQLEQKSGLDAESVPTKTRNISSMFSRNRD